MNISKIVKLGIKPNDPLYIRKNIKLFNKVIMIFFLFMIPYNLFTYAYLPKLIVYPLVVVFVGMFCLFLNALREHKLSRFLFVLSVNLLITIYHASLVNGGDPPLVSLYGLQLGLVFLPFLLFDYREKVLLIGSLIIFIALYIGFPLWSEIFEEHIDNSIFKEGPIAFYTNFMACLILCFSILTLVYINYVADLRNQKLLEDQTSKNNALEASEKELQETIKKIDISKEQEKNRAWINDGLAQFSNLLKEGNKNYVEKVLNTIVKYVGAAQGTLYLIKESEGSQYMQQEACYAFGRKKLASGRFMIGEGLVGECFRDKEILYLTEIPENYIKIKSGLGEAPPRNIVIIPLIFNDSIVGIIEMALFKILESYEVDFLKRASEVIAIQILNDLTKQETQEQIEKTKIANQLLIEQEEVMRQNMEEMVAIQEELQMKENEYLDEIAELKNMLHHQKSNLSLN